jgi:hypothetical protein
MFIFLGQNKFFNINIKYKLVTKIQKDFYKFFDHM